ncbi:tRNA (N6-threonylcarbamoyladenosine(37)-N6)-methyltransferase TrmO [Aliikangiella maris]|uniref:tRNA (N6-threonylcarbamoyladenosine(37)-N6)-methyltransferase TrmO n=2 Tax=Aliikangiella maris TaxID=3162458 RepID=A0ABV3MT44_9GAMM
MNMTTPSFNLFQFKPIGIIHSPYKQKFAIPRQPRLVKQIEGLLALTDEFSIEGILAGIENYSHLWITFIFHQTLSQGWSAKVRPPRLGGNDKMGVFATRSTFRPNPIGLSAVENLGHYQHEGKYFIRLGGIDLLDQTPIVDIKPYIPYCDAIPDAQAGIAQTQPSSNMPVSWSPQAIAFCKQNIHSYPNLQTIVSDILQQDPRPAYKKKNILPQNYSVYLYDLNIHWTIENQQTLVTHINKK